MAYDRLGEDACAEGVKLQYHQQVLKLGTDEELTLSGYCRAFCKMFVFYFISLVTLGIPFLLVYWKPEWGVFWKRRRCALMEADMLIIKVIDCYFKCVVWQILCNWCVRVKILPNLLFPLLHFIIKLMCSKFYYFVFS